MRQKIIRYCKNCGKELNERHKVFCDNHCQGDYEYKEFIEAWKNGVVNGLRGKYSISNHIRRYLFEKYEGKCQLCGWGETNPITNKVPLEVHHIDGDFKNNAEDNLQLLCPNCHSLTTTFKRLNKEGRKKTGFHVVDSNKELKFETQPSIEDCKWLINIEKANEAEKKLIRKLYSMEIIDLTILLSQLLERGDDLNEKEQMLNKWLEMVRDRKARGIELTEI